MCIRDRNTTPPFSEMPRIRFDILLFLQLGILFDCAEDVYKRQRVVWGLEVTIATFSPTSRFVRLDLPTFGRPMTATNTEDVSCLLYTSRCV